MIGSMGSRARLALAAGLILLASACGTDPEAPRHINSAESSAVRENAPSALKDPTNPAFPDPLIELDHLVSGGPPPDGIPPIDNPKFQPARDVDWLEGAEPVLSLTVEGETRAYPLQIMTWHEIVNDTVGAVPVTVTYCPLCNSGVAFHRRVGDRLLDFGAMIIGSLHEYVH